MRLRAALAVALVVGLGMAAFADGYLWISCEHISPFSIYRFNLRTLAIDDLVTLTLDSNARVYNNLAFDGKNLYAGTNDSNLFAKLNPYTGRVRSSVSYSPPQPYSAYEDGTYNPQTGTLWRAGQSLTETDTNGNILHIYPASIQLYGLAWANGRLWATDFSNLGYLTIDSGTANFHPVTLAGGPPIKMALAYDARDRIMYLSTLDWLTQTVHLYAANLDMMTATEIADLSQSGYPIGFSNADAMDWVPAEDEAWAERYNGPTNGPDKPSAMVVDGQGNVTVTGYETTANMEDYLTIRYAPNGQVLWRATYDGDVHGSDVANAMTLMPDGGVAVTGRSDGPGTNWDLLTIRYSASGAQQWGARYNGPGNGPELGTSVTADSDGNVYVCGHSWGLNGVPNYVTLKYDKNGNQLWEQRYTNGIRDVPIRIALDPWKNVVVSGWSGSANGLDYVTIKYTNDGNQLWLARYDGPGHWDDVNRGFVIDAQGNIYVTGRSWGAGTSWDFGTVKYSPDGQLLWERRIDAHGGGPDEPTCLALSPDGIVISGWSMNVNPEIWTVSYDTNGNVLWQRGFQGNGQGYANRIEAIKVDKNGGIYLAGRCQGTLNVYDWDVCTLWYTRQGDLQRVAWYNGPVDGDDGATMIGLGPDYSVYVGGSSQGDGTDYDWIVLKYLPATMPTAPPPHAQPIHR